MKFDIDRWINFVLIGEILSCSYLQLVYMRALCTNTPAIQIYTNIEGKTYVFCKTCHTVKQKCKVSWKHAVYLKQLPSFHHNGLLACTFEVFLILQAYLGVDEHLHLLNCYTSRCEIKRISITTTYGTIAKMIQTVAM